MQPRMLNFKEAMTYCHMTRGELSRVLAEHSYAGTTFGGDRKHPLYDRHVLDQILDSYAPAVPDEMASFQAAWCAS